MNILKPPSRAHENWPKCSFFGVYDGHGGAGCADFLRDNLHQFVIKEASFPWNPRDALVGGFMAAEKKFLEMAHDIKEGRIVDKSGSCAVVTLIVGDMCYVANVGDSRCILSGHGGTKIYPLTRDHKPADENERRRITDAGGQIYQTATPTMGAIIGMDDPTDMIIGPYRVFPGRLSVSRTFGDFEAKLEKFGGNPLVVISTPDIKSFKIAKDHDFVVMASDGIFDKLANKETVQCVWNAVEELRAEGMKVHQLCGKGVEAIIGNSLLRRSLDNVTALIIAFSNFKKIACPSDKSSKELSETSTDLRLSSGKKKHNSTITQATNIFNTSSEVTYSKNITGGKRESDTKILHGGRGLSTSRLTENNRGTVGNAEASVGAHLGGTTKLDRASAGSIGLTKGITGGVNNSAVGRRSEVNDKTSATAANSQGSSTANIMKTINTIIPQTARVTKKQFEFNTKIRPGNGQEKKK